MSSYSYTESITFTVTHARHMAAKIATDLKRIQRLYGWPSDREITDYEEEAVAMMKAGYLGAVTYGFKRNGSGKTELAETIGDAVARQEGIELTLFPLSLATRGQGRVGEMTQLLSAAFEHTVQAATRLKGSDKAKGGIILLVDEADALAQSREAAQMHHEDRAGVNAFIRGIDRLANLRLPAAVIMCTNRLNALDPAVRRRAADIMAFARPNDEQRAHILSLRLSPLGVARGHVQAIVDATGQSRTGPGFTFSDLTQRLLPAIALDAYPDRAVEGPRAVEIARAMKATPAFRDEAVGDAR